MLYPCMPRLANSFRINRTLCTPFSAPQATRLRHVAQPNEIMTYPRLDYLGQSPQLRSTFRSGAYFTRDTFGPWFPTTATATQRSKVIKNYEIVAPGYIRRGEKMLRQCLCPRKNHLDPSRMDSNPLKTVSKTGNQTKKLSSRLQH